MRRALLLAACLLALVTGCGSSKAKGQLGARIYIKMAMADTRVRAQGFAGLFPKRPETVPCVIHGGGPSPGIRVAGTCATSGQAGSDGQATVRFVESWDGSLFRGPGSGGRSHLSHTWELKIEPRFLGGDKVLESRTYGDFPPQLVR